MSEVKIVHLLNGVDLITEVTKNLKGLTIFKNPCVIQLSQDPNNPQKIGIRLNPWLTFTEEKEVSINPNHIVFMVDPITDMTNQYKQIFGGIVIANAGEMPKNVTPLR